MMDLRRLIRELESIRGTGTQLISLYIPPGYPRGDLASMLTDEYSKASNIKDKTTRKNVQAALQKIMVYLKSIDYRIPPNGLIIFCGNISDKPGESDIRLYAVEPPYPSPKIYRCDSTFYLEPLKEMVKPKDVYGVIVLDGKEATIATVEGNKIIIEGRARSLAPGKHSKGGQSARRFERLREQAEHEYYKKVGELARAAFEGRELKGIVVGGPGPAKHEFLKKDYLPHWIKEKVIGVVDTGYTDEYGVREVIENARDLFKESEYARQREVFNTFMKEVIKGGLAVYGKDRVLRALREGRVEKLMISEDFEETLLLLRCKECGQEFLSFRETQCPVCGGETEVVERRDAMEEIVNMAEDSGTEVYVVSPETEEGLKLKKAFGGVAGVLRYKA